jgi:aminoglycoside 3-N-acetyltransferase
MLFSNSKILYLRASLKPLARKIKLTGGIVNLLHEFVDFDELFVPYFHGARPFWVGSKMHALKSSNSGALGKLISTHSGSLTSKHPTHAFTGYGDRVVSVLGEHDGTKSCFYPLEELAKRYDFSMLLLGCVEESPGFSTVHVAQNQLGLSQRHLLRFLLRWDELQNGAMRSRIAPEMPGCSKSFDKFYPYYESEMNLLRGELYGVSWIYIPSALGALNTELSLLNDNGYFVDCGRITCLACRLRFY